MNEVPPQKPTQAEAKGPAPNPAQAKAEGPPPKSHSTVPPGTYAETLMARQRAKVRRMLGWLLFAVGVPTLIAALYYGLVASDIYVSEARLTIKTRGESSAMSDILGGGLGASFGIRSTPEASLVVDYIRSPGILRELMAKLDFEGIYATPDADILMRLDPSDSFEDKFDYYLDMVEARLDTESQLVELTVRAFDPEDARRVAEAILSLSENLVNRFSAGMRRDMVKDAEAELEEARATLSQAKRDLTMFRTRHGELDPEQAANTVGQVVGTVYQELVNTRTELAQARAYMREDTPKISALRTKIAALEKQLEQERARLAGQGREATYATLLAEYGDLILAEELATAMYQVNLAALEEARREAARQHIYLLAYVPPTLPDEAAEPERLRMVGTVALLAFAIFGILSLVIAAIREHAKV